MFLCSLFVCGINSHSVIFHYVMRRSSRPAQSYPKNTVDLCLDFKYVFTRNYFCITAYKQFKHRQTYNKPRCRYTNISVLVVYL